MYGKWRFIKIYINILNAKIQFAVSTKSLLYQHKTAAITTYGCDGLFYSSLHLLLFFPRFIFIESITETTLLGPILSGLSD